MLNEEEAAKIGTAIVAKADELCFPGWEEQEHMQTELFREFTILLANQFPAADLLTAESDFVTRCIRLLQKAKYKAHEQGLV